MKTPRRDDSPFTNSEASFSDNSDSSEQDDNLLEHDRDQLIKRQANFILEAVVNFNKNDFNQLTQQLLLSIDPKTNKPLKSDSFRLALNNDDLTDQQNRAVRNAYLERKIGNVKTRDFDNFSKKTIGDSSGIFAKKSKTSTSIDNNIKKYENIWLKKSSNNKENMNQIAAGDICEYLATNIVNQIMEENSPKIRLHKDRSGNVTILSKFIENFKTLKYFPRDTSSSLITNSANFAEFFIANILVADHDFHNENVGIVKNKNDLNYIARIDLERAFHYNITGKNYNSETPKLKKDIPSIFMEEMLREGYPMDKFDDIEVMANIIQIIRNIDFRDMHKIISLSLSNIKEAYGDDFLTNQETSRILKERMGFKENTDLNDGLITKTILLNMRELQKQILDFSVDRTKEVFPEHYKQALKISIEQINSNGYVDIPELLVKIKEKAPDFDYFSPNHFNSEDNLKYQEAISELINYEPPKKRKSYQSYPIIEDLNESLSERSLSPETITDPRFSKRTKQELS